VANRLRALDEALRLWARQRGELLPRYAARSSPRSTWTRSAPSPSCQPAMIQAATRSSSSVDSRTACDLQWAYRPRVGRVPTWRHTMARQTCRGLSVMSRQLHSERRSCPYRAPLRVVGLWGRRGMAPGGEPSLPPVDQGGVWNESGGENAEHPILLQALTFQKIVLFLGRRNRISEIVTFSRLIALLRGEFL